MRKCRISYVNGSWEFYSPYGLRVPRATFAEAIAVLDGHLWFLRRHRIVPEWLPDGGDAN